MTVYDIVIVASGTSRKELRVPVVDAAGAPIDITGASARLQGKSLEISTTIDVAGSVFGAGANGIFRWTGLGTLISPANLGARATALFTCEVKFTDASGVDYTERFGLRFVPALI